MSVRAASFLLAASLTSGLALGDYHRFLLKSRSISETSRQTRRVRVRTPLLVTTLDLPTTAHCSAPPRPPSASASPASAVHSPSLFQMAPSDDRYLIQLNENLLVLYDSFRRGPVYALERLDRDSLRGAAHREGVPFHEEPKILNPDFRSSNQAFHGSGFDRGHMAPAADFRGLVSHGAVPALPPPNSAPPSDEDDDRDEGEGGAGKASEAVRSTFSLANVSPQQPALNRAYWARLEALVRHFQQQQQQQQQHSVHETFVLTGPLHVPFKTSSGEWIMQHKTIGKFPSLVSVPTHYFKVVLARLGNGAWAVQAFLLPNAEVQPATPLEAFVVPLRVLENLAGMRIFPQVLDPSTRDALDAQLLDPARSPLKRVAAGAAVSVAGGRSFSDESRGSLVPLRPAASPNGAVTHLCGVFPCVLPPEKRRRPPHQK
jgi:endonuclease G